MNSSVDLIYYGGDVTEWQLGDSHHTDGSLQGLKGVTQKLIDDTTAEWIVFWNFANDEPPISLIQELSEQPVDIFHAGLKLGMSGLPDVLNYVHPTWMYNVDGDTGITHSNFRLSFGACMIRVNVLRQLGLFSDEYQSAQMSAIAYGYKALKQGAIVRYHAGLVNRVEAESFTPSTYDEWVFAKQFFTPKWQYWTLVNRPKKQDNLKAFLATKEVDYVKAVPSLHSSAKTNEKVISKTVSILAPTLDRYLYIKEELRELNEQTIVPHEVLITDQTDKDRRQPIDFSQYPNLHIKYYPQDEKGQCIAWNKLIEEATGEYIFFFGDDAFNIQPNMIEKMLQTMQRFGADMVAANVIEKGIKYGQPNYHYYMSDTFPITMIKKSVVVAAGGMDMFFNRNAKADHDLAMRCHLNGALMIFDTSAEIGHHRAPSGGLRAHNARVITNFMTKNTISKVLSISTSEMFIYNKYYTYRQYLNQVRIKYMNQLIINGNVFKKLLRLVVFAYKIPRLKRAYNENMRITKDEFLKRGIKFKK